MSDVEIRETTITPDAAGAIVGLQISDVPLQDEQTAAIRVAVSVKLPAYKHPLLAQMQREALAKVPEALRKLDRISAANGPSILFQQPILFSETGRKLFVENIPVEEFEELRRLPKRLLLDAFLQGFHGRKPAP